MNFGSHDIFTDKDTPKLRAQKLESTFDRVWRIFGELDKRIVTGQSAAAPGVFGHTSAMPDVGGTNTDHDKRYYTKSQTQRLIAAAQHDPVTVRDTSTVNITLTGQQVSADVIQSGLDHGSIGGLSDDDHTQYHNDTRGDARYSLLAHRHGEVYNNLLDAVALDFDDYGDGTLAGTLTMSTSSPLYFALAGTPIADIVCTSGELRLESTVGGVDARLKSARDVYLEHAANRHAFVNKSLVIGPSSIFGDAYSLELAASLASDDRGDMALSGFGAAGNEPTVAFYRAGGTRTSITDTTDGLKLGRMRFAGRGVGAWSWGAEIAAIAEGNHGVLSAPAKLAFYTTPTGQSDPALRLTIDKDGHATFEQNVVIKDTKYLVMSGTAASPIAGLIFDTTTAPDELRLFTTGNSNNTIRIKAGATSGSVILEPGTSTDGASELQFKNIRNAGGDTDKFLVLSGDNARIRTGAEVLSDIGAVGGSGTQYSLPRMATATTIEASCVATNSANNCVGINGPALTGFISELLAALVVGNGSGNTNISAYGTDGGGLYFSTGASGSATYQGFLTYYHPYRTLYMGAAGVAVATINRDEYNYGNFSFYGAGDAGASLRFFRGTTQCGDITGTSANFTISTVESKPMRFNIVSTTAMAIDSACNIGIGTLSPTDTHGFGRAVDIHATTFGGAIYLRKSSDTTKFGYVGYDYSVENMIVGATGAGGIIRFDAAGSERMRIDYAGNVYTANTRDTPEGGRAIKCVAGETLAQGEIVCFLQGSTAGRVYKAPTTGNSADMPIGVVYAAAAAAGDTVWVVVSGRCKVLPEAGITAVFGYIVSVSTATAGRATQEATPSTVQHWREVGHWEQNGSGNGALTDAFVHFN